MIKDTLNLNSNIKHDYRNLIIELYSIERGGETSRSYKHATRYFYDESGNRIRKLIYFNDQANPGPVLDWDNLDKPGNGWALSSNEFYIRGVDGKELAIYNSDTLKQWNVYGLDNVGKLVSNQKYYYIKDHLGSVRATLDEAGNTVSAQDYDAWGYLLSGRTYDSDESKYKFTGKERDKENLYDYFGARYYDARIGRWGQVEPLIDKYPQISPYNYSLDNLLKFFDPNGKDVIPIFYLKYRIESSGMSIPYIGHVGVLLINNKNGETVYYDYGRYGKNGKGEVRKQNFENVLGYKYEGVDENKINNVLKEISRKFGKGSEITGAYIESDNFEAMQAYAESYFDYTTNPDSEDEYNFLINSCTSF